MSDAYAALAPVFAMFCCLGMVFFGVFAYLRFKKTNEEEDDT